MSDDAIGTHHPHCDRRHRPWDMCNSNAEPMTAQAPDPTPKPLEELLADWDSTPDDEGVSAAGTADEMASRLRAVASAVEGWPADWMGKEHELGSPMAGVIVAVHRALAGEEGK